MADFQTALNVLLSIEGGYKDDGAADDPTNYGIDTPKAHAFGYTGDMADIDMDTVTAIYQEDWDDWNLGALTNQSVANELFQLMENMGAGGAAPLIQKALKDTGWTGTQDGAWGPQTLAGVNAVPSASTFGQALSDEAANRYTILAQKPQNAKYLNGWLKRAQSIATSITDNPTTSIGLLLAVGLGVYFFMGRKA